jgi:ABC-type transport system involved in multi-copper enzyme maturation permease subunit
MVRLLLLENPFLLDRGYLLRRLIGGSQTGRRTAFFIIAGLLLLFLVGLSGTFPSFLSPKAVLQTQNFIFCFLVPTLLYPAIATEREKRSWDLLRVCPLTDGQIVFGKFAVAMLFVLFTSSFFLVPCAVSELAASTQVHSGDYGLFDRQGMGFFEFLLGEAVSLSFAAGLGALTVWISARAKRGFTALLTVLGILVLFMIFVPTLIGSFGIGSSRDAIAFFWHPFYVASALGSGQFTPDGVWEQTNSTSTAVVGILFWSGIATLSLYLATLCLDDPDSGTGAQRKSHA